MRNKKKTFVKIKSLWFENFGTGVLFGFQRLLSFFRFKTFSINIFLGLGSQKFLGIVWDLVEFLGLGLGSNSENFGIGTGIEFEKFWEWDWDWD